MVCTILSTIVSWICFVCLVTVGDVLRKLYTMGKYNHVSRICLLKVIFFTDCYGIRHHPGYQFGRMVSLKKQQKHWKLTFCPKMNHLPSINVSVANMCSGPSFRRRCFGLVHTFSIPSCILSFRTRENSANPRCWDLVVWLLDKLVSLTIPVAKLSKLWDLEVAVEKRSTFWSRIKPLSSWGLRAPKRCFLRICWEL